MAGHLVHLPSWMSDVIRVRAQALGVDFDEALVASLDISSTDLLVESAGWAVATRAEPAGRVARRVSYSKRAVENAARRYRDRPR